MLTEKEARNALWDEKRKCMQSFNSEIWKQAMEEFNSRKEYLKQHSEVNYVYNNGYVLLNSGDVVWHTLVN